MDVNSFYKNKEVLVIGHTGFMGSWLTKWLTLLSAHVTGYALNPPTIPNIFDALSLNSEISDIRGDIRNNKLLRQTIHEVQPQIVFHLAAQPIVLKSYDDPVETFDVNVTGTVNLLNALRKVDSVKTIIVVTSDKSYRNNEWVYPYRENDILGGKDPYSASKSCQDIVVDSFRESYFSEIGVGISSVRAGNVIGGGDWAEYRIISDIVRGIVQGETIKVRNPNAIRPWQHVMEPISGMLMLAEKMSKELRYAGAWNFGPENIQTVRVVELVKIFVDLWGSGRYSIQENEGHKEAGYLKLDISKAKNELGWHPRYTFMEAMEETVNWYKAYYRNQAMVSKVTEDQIVKYLSPSTK